MVTLINTDTIRAAVFWLKTTLVEQAKAAGIVDFAVLGNASGRYDWTPSRVADVDLWIFAASFSPPVGFVLNEILQSMRVEWNRKGFSVMWKAVNGPYKPLWYDGQDPIIFIHLIMDTAESMVMRNPFILRSWSKYECAFRRERLVEFDARTLSLDDLRRSERGPLHGQWMLSQQLISYPAFSLPSLERTSFDITLGSPESYELCFYLVGTNARNHARVVGFSEPDHLNHETFGVWYLDHLLKSNHFRDVMDWKIRSRRGEFVVEFEMLRVATMSYLRELEVFVA